MVTNIILVAGKGDSLIAVVGAGRATLSRRRRARRLPGPVEHGENSRHRGDLEGDPHFLGPGRDVECSR